MDSAEIAAVVIVVVVGLFVVLFVVPWLLLRVLSGAAVLFGWALEQGFLGAVAYWAAWVFLLPIMLGAAFIIGAWTLVSEKRAERDAKRVAHGLPPRNADERHRWANRLPPYDQ